MKVSVDEPSYVYVFHQSSSGENINTLFPPSQEDLAKEKGAIEASAGSKDLKIAAKPQGSKAPPSPASAGPVRKHPTEFLLQPGDFFTCPSGLETNFSNTDVKQDINVGAECYGLAGAPGAETMIVLSSHYPISFYGDQDSVNGFFKKASGVLDQYELDSGLQIDSDLLKPGMLSVDKRSSGTSATQVHQRNSVFLTRLAVRHR